MDRRNVFRNIESSEYYPISFRLKIKDREIVARPINYHFKGACFAVDPVYLPVLFSESTGTPVLDFYLGERCLKSNVPYRVCWSDENEKGVIGIEFLTSIRGFIERETRIRTHEKFRPTLTCKDPLDVNRIVYFHINDISLSGMLLTTSLSNKDLFPGMELQNAALQIPGSDTIHVDLVIQNTRLANDGNFSLGVSVRGNSLELFRRSVQSYLAFLAPPETTDQFSDDVFLSKKIPLGKQLKAGLTFKIITSNDDYEKVLKLRYLGYSKHGKVPQNTKWEHMGEGLNKEGMIVCGYLGSQMISSMELRFGSSSLPLRIKKYLPDGKALAFDESKVVEVNKLVIHPSSQGTDIVLGMIQKVHSIVIAKGGLDVLMVATPKLVPLYTRIGGEPIGVTVPHPVLTGVSLVAMVVKREVYMGEADFNTFLWNGVYSATHEMFKKYGLTQGVKVSPFKKVRHFLQILLLKRKKKSPNAQQNEELAPEDKIFIDPKWTRQHMVASIILPYVLVAEEMIGADKVSQILNQLGVPRHVFYKQTHWISIGFLDAFVDAFSRFGDIRDLNYKAGIRSMRPDIMGLNYFFLKHFLTPEFAFKSFEKILPRFNRTRSYKLIDVGSGYAKIEVGMAARSLLPKHRESCANWIASFESYIRLMTGREGQVKKLMCCFEDHHACVYEIRWINVKKLGGQFVLMLALFLSCFLAYEVSSQFGFSSFMAGCMAVGVAIVSRIVYLEVAVRLKEGDRAVLRDEFERYQQESSESYKELQQTKSELDQRYREAVLLESTTKEIQSSTDLTKILNISLKRACELLGFDRAFVMLVNEEKTLLKTAAVVGIDQELGSIWEFSVDITGQRKNPLLLSNVFQTGNPVMINDAEAHAFQLNDSSRALIKALGTKSFVMVGIPSEKGNWGVVLADKGSKSSFITQKDIVLLQRVTQHLGIALDKQAKIDVESRLRTLFQKYVPSQILDAVNLKVDPKLGGNQREIICMFLDIRGFTKMSSPLPASATLDLLNRLFEKIYQIVTRHGGVIDKFLGDGVFLTWGAIGNSSPTGTEAVWAAFEILGSLPLLNEANAKDGLPKISVGIGIHKGMATVGNIGVKDRMEFTCIGSTVNLASRLEGLCKSLKTELVISEGLYHSLINEQKEAFVVVSEVTIAGIDQAVMVAKLKEDVKLIKAVA